MRIFSWPHLTDGEADSERLKLPCCVRTYTAYKKASQDSKIDLPNSPNQTVGEFSSAPAVRTLFFRCQGPRFDPGQGTISCTAQPKNKTKRNCLVESNCLGDDWFIRKKATKNTESVENTVNSWNSQEGGRESSYRWEHHEGRHFRHKGTEWKKNRVRASLGAHW